MKTLKEETFGLKEGKDQPLYAYGNQISFFRLPVYPESKPKADCIFFGNPYDAATTFRMGAR